MEGKGNTEVHVSRRPRRSARSDNGTPCRPPSAETGAGGVGHTHGATLRTIVCVRFVRSEAPPCSHITHLKRAPQHRSSGISTALTSSRRIHRYTRDASAPHKICIKSFSAPTVHLRARGTRPTRLELRVPPLTPREWSDTRSLTRRSHPGRRVLLRLGLVPRRRWRPTRRAPQRLFRGAA